MGQTLTKQSKKNLNTWVCPNGCPVSKNPCKHLDKLLPSLKSGRLGSDFLTEYANRVLDSLSVDEYEEGCHAMEGRLKHAGFNPTETYLIMDRMVSGLSIKELSKKYGTNQKLMIVELGRLINEIKEKGVFGG